MVDKSSNAFAPLHPVVRQVTDRIRQRSQDGRRAYLERVDAAAARGTRSRVSCTNLAHVMAAAAPDERLRLRAMTPPNLGIVSAYNDMLSAHQPLAEYPALIKQAAMQEGATALFAGGVPAMCDGVTQGQDGMELSLWSRDVIAQATAIALSHAVFDGALMLGVCDKIVPGLLIGALTFGHLPTVFVPAGPMTSGLGNSEKAKVRQLFAQGLVDREALLDAELSAYHAAGTCTFYGTANSNQMLMEFMGLHLPGSAFVNPGTPLRTALTLEAGRWAARASGRPPGERVGIGRQIDERSLVNALIGLLATGGSTNHTLHLVAVARAAGLLIDWTDFAELSAVVPLLARVYPNGSADVNQFHAAGGLALVIRELLLGGLLHPDAGTLADFGALAGHGLAAYTFEPYLDGERVAWRAGPTKSLDTSIVRPLADPFQPDGGMRLVQGNLGRAIFKSSAVAPSHRRIEAPARVFDNQQAVVKAFKAGELDRDVIVVVRFQGPRANGMPELHQLTPSLGVLQDRGFKVALVTDGRMSGASGKVPAAIHLCPESACGGPLARVRDGDLIVLDAERGELNVRIDSAQFAQRPAAVPEADVSAFGCGRELFASHRAVALTAEEGALSWLA